MKYEKKPAPAEAIRHADMENSHLYTGLGGEKELEYPKLLLHSCCGPCSTSVIERLMNEYSITVFFYNPNITDSDEYIRRRKAQLTVIDRFNSMSECINKIGFMEGRYEPDLFVEKTYGLEEEPEGGRRCGVCFSMRMEETALTARMNGFDTFTSKYYIIFSVK